MAALQHTERTVTTSCPLKSILSRALKYFLEDIIIVIRKCITPHISKNYKGILQIMTEKERYWCITANFHNDEHSFSGKICEQNKWKLTLSILDYILKRKIEIDCINSNMLRLIINKDSDNSNSNNGSDVRAKYVVNLNGIEYIVSFSISNVKLNIDRVTNENNKSEEILKSVTIENIDIYENDNDGVKYKVSQVVVNTICGRARAVNGVRSRCNPNKIKLKINSFKIKN